MFSGGIDATQTAAQIAQTNYMNFQTNSGIAGMAGSAFNAVCGAIATGVAGSIISNATQRQYESQGVVADKQMQIQLDYLNTQEQKMEVTVDLKKVSNEWAEKRAEAEAKLQIVEGEIVQKDLTREMTRVETKKLDQMFSRNERFRGQPVRPIPSDSDFSESGMYR